MSVTSREVAIAGAGLAGSLAAIYLARRDFRVTLYEQRPDMRRHDVPAGRSINLALAYRGIRALESVGLMARVRPLLIAMRGRCLHDRAGNTTFQPYSRRPGEAIYSVSRNQLNTILLEAAEEAGATMEFGQRVSAFDCATGILTLEDEQTGRSRQLAAVPLIAADGAGSVIRQAMQAQFGVAVSEEILEHGYKELTIPAGPGGRHQLDPNALHIWPRGGYMLIALPNLDGTFTVTLFLAHDDDPGFNRLDNTTSLQNFFQKEFADATRLMPNLAEEFFSHPTGIMGTVRCGRWHVNGRVLLLGDAAHAVVPFHGQGMNCAFEDCLVLERCLERERHKWGEAFADFERQRRADAAAIADMALENYVEMRDSVRDPKFHLRKEVGWLLEERYPEVFIPRYSMVMFRDLPYAEAQYRGAIQAEILEKLCANITAASEVDFTLADRLIRQKLLPALPSP